MKRRVGCSLSYRLAPSALAQHRAFLFVAYVSRGQIHLSINPSSHPPWPVGRPPLRRSGNELDLIRIAAGVAAFITSTLRAVAALASGAE